jgi:release factor glutamine methyltransferase
LFEYAGLQYETRRDVYAPAEDSWLLVDAVAGLGDLSDRLVVEVGCGAGLALLAAVRQGARGVGVDRNPAALRLARRNAELNGLVARVGLVRGDLLSALALNRVDLLLFNPPYLPTAPEERLGDEVGLAVEGGESGDEVVLRFVTMLEAARRVDKPVPAVLLVTSSLNDRAGIRAALARAGLDQVEPLGEAASFFERLHVEHYRAGP